ncbi:Choline-phosphate cytidylyltransferase 1 [Hondaea fermentalgiana]|uniref:Choline-phosphate cytidylyltransferase 1 n=1 Tax=Hondaea fermentalgiana TaxID=2315210 RepID=A0A2R5GNV7_9STRA|nr:Choline-phosphate cytidylyltransferase 1 [Hondaea fermentalgiana]|eukprot:GBG30313.1 Choline-phosphate cytidylyltransferase 1 [Hondaea fermentalgiana]
MVLTEIECENFANYETVVHDKSLTRQVFEPFWDRVVYLLPEDVAPNLISLAASLCLVQAWYLCYTQGDDYPEETTTIAMVLIFIFWTLDAVDSKQAQRIGNDSSLTEFFDHMCSAVGTIFLVLTLCQAFHLPIACAWYYVQIGQLLILNKHLSALKKEFISYRIFNGPGEAISAFILMLGVRAVVGMPFIDDIAAEVISVMQQAVPPRLYDAKPDLFDQPSLNLARTLFFWIFVYSVVMTLNTGKEHRVTSWSLLLCLFYLLLASGIILFHFEFTLPGVIAQGLVTAMLSSDLVVARMANRPLTPVVVIINMAALGSNLVSFILVPMYYGSILFQVCRATRLPLLTRVTNVYLDGIFDMAHLGHFVAFKNAAKFGTRLFVGVVNDEDASPYKRRPIMNERERADVVGAAKYVYKVIENAPCVKGGLDEAFLKKHRIHVVAHGEEYDKPTDEWYAIPRKLGMTRVLPRFEGMSTSELIRRINSRKADELARSAPAETVKGKNTV